MTVWWLAMILTTTRPPPRSPNTTQAIVIGCEIQKNVSVVALDAGTEETTTLQRCTKRAVRCCRDGQGLAEIGGTQRSALQHNQLVRFQGSDERLTNVAGVGVSGIVLNRHLNPVVVTRLFPWVLADAP